MGCVVVSVATDGRTGWLVGWLVGRLLAGAVCLAVLVPAGGLGWLVCLCGWNLLQIVGASSIVPSFGRPPSPLYLAPLQPGLTLRQTQPSIANVNRLGDYVGPVEVIGFLADSVSSSALLALRHLWPPCRPLLQLLLGLCWNLAGRLLLHVSVPFLLAPLRLRLNEPPMGANETR